MGFTAILPPAVPLNMVELAHIQQVGPAVVKGIIVDVVRDLSIRRLCNVAVCVHENLFAVGAVFSDGVVFFACLTGRPLEPAELIEVLGVDFHKEPPSQRQ